MSNSTFTIWGRLAKHTPKSPAFNENEMLTLKVENEEKKYDYVMVEILPNIDTSKLEIDDVVFAKGNITLRDNSLFLTAKTLTIFKYN